MIRRLLSRVSRGVVLGLVPGLLVIGASGAHPAYAAGPFDIMNVGNNECLSEENPAVIVIDPCDDTMRQDWKKVTANGHLLIRNALTGHCLTVSDTGAGGQVIVATSPTSPSGCNFSGTDRSELWDFPGSKIENVAASLFMQPSGCMSGDDVLVFINDGTCNASNWNSSQPS